MAIDPNLVCKICGKNWHTCEHLDIETDDKRCPNCEKWEAEQEGSELMEKPCAACSR